MALIVISTLYNISSLYANAGRLLERKNHYSHSKSPRADRHRPQQRWPNSLPKPSCPLHPIRLRETIPHRRIFLVRSKTVTLHFALHNIKRIATQPQRLPCQASIRRDFDLRNLVSFYTIARSVCIHHVLECQKPHSVGLRLADDCDRFTSVQAGENAFVRGELPDAIYRARVEMCGAMGLRLQADTDVFDGT